MRQTILRLGAVIISLGLVLTTTDPQTSSPFVLAAPFIACFLLIFLLSKRVAAIKVFAQIARPNLIAVFLALFLTLLLVLISLGQMSPKDIAALAILLTLSYYYVSHNVFAD